MKKSKIHNMYAWVTLFEDITQFEKTSRDRANVYHTVQPYTPLFLAQQEKRKFLHAGKNGTA